PSSPQSPPGAAAAHRGTVTGRRLAPGRRVVCPVWAETTVARNPRGDAMRRLAAAAIAAMLVALPGLATAQQYPARTITLIVPFPAGGPTDTLARILGERMRVALGQTIVIENVTGAGASIGVTRAVQSAADGYTLSIGNWTSHVGAGAMYPVSWDALKD